MCSNDLIRTLLKNVDIFGISDLRSFWGDFGVILGCKQKNMDLRGRKASDSNRSRRARSIGALL